MEVLLRLLDEFLDAQLICEHTILLVVLEDTEVGLSGHQQSIVLDDVDEAEPEEVQRDMHKVRSAVGHQTDDIRVGADHLRVRVGRDVLFDLAHALCLLHVQGLALQDYLLTEGVGHLVLELEEDLEELTAEDSEVFLF